MASDLSPADVATSEAVVGRSMRVTHEVVLAAVLAAEIAVFARSAQFERGRMCSRSRGCLSEVGLWRGDDAGSYFGRTIYRLDR